MEVLILHKGAVSMTLFLNGDALTIEDIKQLLHQDLKIEITEEALERVKK